MPLQLDQPRYEQELQLARRRGGVIQKGSRYRGAVRALQQRLVDLGYDLTIDGQFGNETRAQLEHFQQDHGLKVDGVLGKHTLKSLTRTKPPKPGKPNPSDPSIDAITKIVHPGKAPSSSATGRGLGDAGAIIGGGGASTTGGNRSTGGQGRGGQSKHKGRQRKAKTQKQPKGPHGGAIDKATGKETATAKTGPIGPTTPDQPSQYSWDKGKGKAGVEGDAGTQDNNPDFNKAHPRGGKGTAEGGKFIKKGDSGQLVTNSQTALNQTGNYKLKEDGQFGNKTETAVKAFQQKQGLKVDGVVGPVTSAALRQQLQDVRTGKGTPPRARPRATVFRTKIGAVGPGA